MERAKETGTKPHLRYENSIGTNFTKILGGFDELSSSVKDVIIVEGLFDKVGIDNLLQLWDCNSLKCVLRLEIASARNKSPIWKEKVSRM